MSELALAVFIGVGWNPGLEDFKKIPDVAPLWEARHRFHDLGLKVATDDSPDRLVTDITGTRPTFEIHGFIVAEWAQKNVPLTDPGNQGRPAHFVNPYYLTPINEDFHSVHAWFRHSVMGWMCLYCGEFYEEKADMAAEGGLVGAR